MIRFIRYDMVHDGVSKCVNDQYTIRTMEATQDDLGLLEVGSDDHVLSFARREVGLADDVTIDNSGDFGRRVEFLDGEGDPCGAIEWDAEADLP